LRRAGHTEAAIDFARLAGFEPAGVIVEILNEDGTMARLPACRELADRFGLKLVSIADLISFRLENETLIERVADVPIETAYGPFRAIAYRQRTNDAEHLALVKGEWSTDTPVPVRVHSTSMVGDVFHVTDFGKSLELRAAMQHMESRGFGAIVYINKVGHHGGIVDELKAYADRQASHARTGLAQMDTKDYGIGAQILRDLGITKMQMLSNSPRKKGIIGYGLEIIETIPLPC
jgi:3,4-dihydroxy 2-butanone 4-phosphate synthase/GTP cyclohydrolase II